jgi:hypothetical protein
MSEDEVKLRSDIVTSVGLMDDGGLSLISHHAVYQSNQQHHRLKFYTPKTVIGCQNAGCSAPFFVRRCC